MKARLPIFLTSALVLSSVADAQVYVLVNDQGKMILISGAKAADPEAAMRSEIASKGGSGWRVQFASSGEFCWARRAVSGAKRPTKWFFEIESTQKEAEVKAKAAADAFSASGNPGANTWEGAGCNTTSYPLRKLEPNTPQAPAVRGEQSFSDRVINSTKAYVRDLVTHNNNCDARLPTVSAQRLDDQRNLPRAQQTELTKLKGRSDGRRPCVIFDRSQDRPVPVGVRG